MKPPDDVTNELRQRLAEALKQVNQTDEEIPVTDEELAAFVTDELPDAKRQKIIQAAARDPEIAATLAELVQIGLGKKQPQAEVDRDEEQPAPVIYVFPKRAVMSLAIAASLMLAIFTWSVVSPTPATPDPIDFTTLNVPPGGTNTTDPNYWELLDDEEAAQMRLRYELRGYALYITTGVSAFLALWVAYLLLRNQSKPS